MPHHAIPRTVRAVDPAHGVLAFAAMLLGLLLVGGGLGQAGAVTRAVLDGEQPYDLQNASLLGIGLALSLWGGLLAMLAWWIRRGSRLAEALSAAVAAGLAGFVAVFAPFLGRSGWIGAALYASYAVAAALLVRGEAPRRA